MKVVFISNYFNHHQKPLSDAMYRLLDGEYRFMQTGGMSEERKKLGWRKLDAEYVTEYSKEEINTADVVIVGSAPQNKVDDAIKAGKLVFRYSERPLKEGNKPLKFIPRYIKWHKNNPVNKPLYLLSAGKYAEEDYARFGLFKGKAYAWGYFPYFSNCDIEQVLKQKDNTILWAGRLLRWKHTDDAVYLAKMLAESGIDFKMKIIGDGEMNEFLSNTIASENLSQYVHLVGAMSPDEVRNNMLSSSIFIMTSDRNEGWGAVVNEAMNSGCAVVASDAAGATGFLIENGINGLVYSSGNLDELFENVKKLLVDEKERENLGRNAYESIAKEWNAEVAANRLVELSRQILNGKENPELYSSGPCKRILGQKKKLHRSNL